MGCWNSKPFKDTSSQFIKYMQVYDREQIYTSSVELLFMWKVYQQFIHFEKLYTTHSSSYIQNNA